MWAAAVVGAVAGGATAATPIGVTVVGEARRTVVGAAFAVVSAWAAAADSGATAADSQPTPPATRSETTLAAMTERRTSGAFGDPSVVSSPRPGSVELV